MPWHAVTLALLPLENLSGTREDARLAQGFQQDLITELARFPTLGVVSADSVTAARSLCDDEQALARRLGARFLLKGSMRRIGKVLRLNLQLVEGESGRHYWAERYDEERLPELQDEVASRIAGALALQVDQSLLAASRRRPAATLESYECWLRGMECLQRGTCEADAEGRRFFEQALESDPEFARAWAGISLSHFNEWSCQAWQQWEEKERLAYEAAEQAARLDPADALAQLILGRIEQYRRQHDRAAARLHRALQLTPGDANALVQLALCFSLQGEHERGWELAQRAQELNPLCPPWHYCYAAQTLFPLRRYEEQLATARNAPPGLVVDAPAFSAAASAYLGDQQRATAYLEELNEDFSRRIAQHRHTTPQEMLRWILHVNPYREQADSEHLAEGLRRAGLTDKTTVVPATVPLPWPVANLFRREAELWTLSFNHQVIHLADRRGLHDLARLLAKPGEEVSSLELAGAVVHAAALDQVDAKALQAYRRRLRDLDADIESASQAGRVKVAEKLEQERETLLNELKRVTGLGGRTRQTGGAAERARSTVAWRIRHAIKKIEALHPALGRHLRHSVRTGSFCSYQPEQSVVWHL